MLRWLTPFVPGCVWLQEYEGVKWRRTPGGQPIRLLCLGCHHRKWPQDNRFRRVGVTPRFGKGCMCLGVLSSRVWLVSYEGRLCCEYGRTGAAKISFLGQRSPRHLCRQWKVTRWWGPTGLGFTSRLSRRRLGLDSFKWKLGMCCAVLYMLMSGGGLRQGGQQERAGYEWPTQGISIEWNNLPCY